MGMDQLIAALERDAAAEVEKNVQRARAEAAGGLVGCREELAQRLDDELQHRERDLRARIALDMARAHRAGHSEVLRARDVLLGRVRTAVGRRMEELAQDPGYVAQVADELRQAVGYLAEGPAEVVCRPQLAAPLAAAAGALGRGDLSLREDPGLGTGFVLRARDGHAEVDARLDTRLERMWPELSLAVLAAIEERGWSRRAGSGDDGG